MSLREEIKDWQEPETGFVSNLRHPPAHSADNLLLFTSIYMVLLDDAKIADIVWYESLVKRCVLEPGLLVRYPGETNPTSHDDLTGVAVASRLCGLEQLAEDIYEYGRTHGYFWGPRTERERWLARIPDFVPTLLAAAGKSVNILWQMAFCAGLAGNLVEPKAETSGKILIWLKCKAMQGKYRLCDFMIDRWRTAMLQKYPGGMRDVFAIYYGADHPFTHYGPKDFR